ncbi:MBL fold metallo-hydrolase [Burkholderia plantarii]|uniref:MBL fold metallo-hydrolase n=1 Tax=Burkholderia plantarii TaxID=41899 RepID=UPI000B1DEA5E|nr:hypothetical protein [Burkholderia plantarii]
MTASNPSLTLIGGPTVLIEFDGVRLLTDPTIDPPGLYRETPVRFAKTSGPALSVEALGALDAVLLSHDHHFDNLDHAGRAMLPGVPVVLATQAGAGCLGGNARGLAPFETCMLDTRRPAPAGDRHAGAPRPGRHRALAGRRGRLRARHRAAGRPALRDGRHRPVSRHGRGGRAVRAARGGAAYRRRGAARALSHDDGQ